MSTRSFVHILFFTGVLLAGGPVRAQAQTGQKAVGRRPVSAAGKLGGDRRALIIGINDYADRRVPHLRFAESDARNLHKTLTDPQVGGFDADRVTLLLGKQATARNIRKALYNLRQCGDHDLVLIFYSGHGAKQGGETFWVTQDAELADLGPTALSNAELHRLIAKIPSDRVVTLLDCCYAADTVLNQKALLNAAELARVFTGKGRVTIAAAGSGEEAIEIQRFKGGVFTHYLVEGLRGTADANGDGVVTLMEVWSYLESNVAQVARQNKGIQKPTMHMETGQETDKFLLTLNPAAAAGMVEAAAKLKRLFIEEKITAVQYEEGRKLISRPVGSDAAKKRRSVYLDLASGKLSSKYLTAALAALSSTRQRPPPAERPTPPIETARERPRELTLNLGGGVTMELVRIPAGTFRMGSPESEKGRGRNEGPQHRVRIAEAFYLGKTEVTQAQWQAVMGDNRSRFKGDDLPVESVSWEDCQQFCRKLSQRTGKTIRLPSESEWEYACRAGTDTRFSFGDSDSSLGQYAWYDDNSDGETHPVGRKRANAWGLYDMHGNVWESCEDVGHDNYNGAPGTGTAWTRGGIQTGRVLRGGSWIIDPRDCRSAYRDWSSPGNRNYSNGFRVASGTP